MCTAISYKTKDHYFGRTLDYGYSYEETVTICPRRYPLDFRKMPAMEYHYAMIGMAYVVNEYPLFYEATNEKGLSMAGLRFLDNAYYGEESADKDNLASFEFIPWILGSCESVAEARRRIENVNLVNIGFSEALPPSPLHWMISDREASITVEAVRDGIHIYDNPVGILTNNPPFPQQMFSLNNYRSLSSKTLDNTFCSKLPLDIYSLGMGALGLPGDLSSNSRFVRAAFTKLNSVCGDSEEESVSQFFHIMGSVAQTRGCVEFEGDEYEVTIYTSCCNTDKGIFYYTTYENPGITGISMYNRDLNGMRLYKYPMRRKMQVMMER